MRASSMIQPLAALALLGVLTACGGSYHGPASNAPASPGAQAAAATGLSYTNPATGGWALVQDPSSTSTHLVLNLVGPSGLKARGVGFNLGSDGSVKFHKFASGFYVQDTGVFQLKLALPNLYSTTYPDMYEPVLMAGGVKNAGKLLTVGLFQKDRLQPSQSLTAPLCQIAVDFDASLTGALPKGTTIPLTMVRARILPDDIGVEPSQTSGDWSDVQSKFHMVDIAIAVGTLVAN